MIAYVTDYTGPAAGYRIISSVRAKRVAPLLPLDPGDRISVLSRSGGRRLVLHLTVDGRNYTVDAQHSPLCIAQASPGCKVIAPARSAPNAIVTAWRNIFASIASLLRTAKDDQDTGSRVASVGRPAGPVASPPLLQLAGGVEAARIDGKGFAIAWSGGRAPFSVRIISAGGALVSTAATNERAVVMRALTLPPGAYTVKIVDANGAFDDGQVAVVGPQSIPAVACPPDVDQTLCPVVEAAQLAKQGKRWYLAAYEKLALAPQLGDVGRRLMRWLAKG